MSRTCRDPLSCLDLNRPTQRRSEPCVYPFDLSYNEVN
jgi:hypothetical protein